MGCEIKIHLSVGSCGCCGVKRQEPAYVSIGIFASIPAFPLIVIIRYLLRSFDCLANTNLSATLATDQKCPLTCLYICYQSLAGAIYHSTFSFLISVQS